MTSSQSKTVPICGSSDVFFSTEIADRKDLGFFSDRDFFDERQLC